MPDVFDFTNHPDWENCVGLVQEAREIWGHKAAEQLAEKLRLPPLAWLDVPADPSREN